MTFIVSPLLRRLGWGVADQVLSSLTNFLLGVLVARAVTAREFGAFSLAYATYTMALGAARALALDPLVVRFSTGPEDAWRGAVRAAAGTSLAFGALIGTASLGVAMVTTGAPRTAFALLGVALPGLLVQDAWRFSFFARGRGDRAFWNDLVWAAVLFPGDALLLWHGSASMPALIAVWAIAGWTAAAVGLLQTGVIPHASHAVRWLTEQRDLSFRFFGEFLLSSGASHLSLFMVGALATLSDVGRLRAGEMMLGPLNILFLGAGLVAVAETAKLLAQSPQKMDLAVRLVSAILTLGTLGWSVMALLLPASIGEAVMGSNWFGGRSLLLPLAIGAVGVAVSYGPMTGLRALAAARSSLRAKAIDATSTLVLTVTGAAAAGATGAAWGLAVGGCLRIPNWWWHFHQARSAYSRTAVARARPGQGLADAKPGDAGTN